MCFGHQDSGFMPCVQPCHVGRDWDAEPEKITAHRNVWNGDFIWEQLRMTFVGNLAEEVDTPSAVHDAWCLMIELSKLCRLVLMTHYILDQEPTDITSDEVGRWSALGCSCYNIRLDFSRPRVDVGTVYSASARVLHVPYLEQSWTEWKSCFDHKYSSARTSHYHILQTACPYAISDSDSRRLRLLLLIKWASVPELAAVDWETCKQFIRRRSTTALLQDKARNTHPAWFGAGVLCKIN